MRFAAITAIIIGVVMLLQWGFFLLSGQVPELETEPVRIAFHLAAEAVTALSLILAGWLLIQGHPRGRELGLVAFGMLIYTVIVSPGYFAQQGAWPLVAMFAVLLFLAILSIARLLRLSFNKAA